MPSLLPIVVVLLGLVMGAGLTFGIANGDFAGESALLMQMPWGIVSLIEIYVGLGLFACWLFYRESNRLKAFGWLVAAAGLGNIVCCVYVLLSFRQAKGDALRFWMGQRAMEVDHG